MADESNETEEKTMAKNMTQVAKSGGDTYFVKDTTARSMISDEVTAREAAIAAEADARQTAVSAEAEARQTAVSAEAAARNNAIEDIKNALVGYSVNLRAYQGGALSGDTSLDTIYTNDATNRIRSFYNVAEIRSIKATKGTIIKVSAPNTYKYILGIYDEVSGLYIGGEYEYKEGTNIYEVSNNAYICLIAGRNDDSNIAPSEMINISVEILSGMQELAKHMKKQAAVLNQFLQKIAYAESVSSDYHDFLNEFGINLFNNDSLKVSAFINTSVTPAEYSTQSGDYSAIVRIEPGKSYIIKKNYSKVFRIATYQYFPANGSQVLSTTANHEGTEITIQSETNAAWLQIQYYNYALSSDFDEETIFKSIEVLEL